MGACCEGLPVWLVRWLWSSLAGLVVGASEPVPPGGVPVEFGCLLAGLGVPVVAEAGELDIEPVDGVAVFDC